VSVGALVGRLLFPLAGAQRHGAQLAEQKQGSPRAFRESEFAEMVTDSHLFGTVSTLPPTDASVCK
jgi:hypothetical protein